MPKIDLTYLEVLSEDDDAFKNEFIETFESTYRELVDKMRNELEKGDLENLSKSAHQLKPSAKMIQLPAGDTLEQIQHDATVATKQVIEGIFSQCEDALAQLKSWANS